MPLYESPSTKLRSQNSVAHFANLTPKQETQGKMLDGLIGIMRWVGLGVEISLTILATFIPGAQVFLPAITIAGALFQEGLDVVSYVNDKKSAVRNLEFGISTTINVLSLGFSLGGVFGASRNVLRINDTNLKSGFRYVVRGSDEFSEAASALNSGAKTSTRFKSIERVRNYQERNLIKNGTIKPYSETRVFDQFETALQQEFGAKIKTGNAKEMNMTRRFKWYNKNGDFEFSNRDISIIRYSAKQYAKGNWELEKALRYIPNKLSKSARDSLRIVRIGKSFKFKNPEIQSLFGKRLESLSSLYGKRLSNYVALKENVARQMYKNFLERLGNNKYFHFFGTKQGRTLTQIGQLSNPNDIARELVNRPLSVFMNGYKVEKGTLMARLFPNLIGKEFKGLRQMTTQIRNFAKTKFPRFYGILEKGVKTKAMRLYKETKDAIEKVGVKTKDDTFLMGWRVINHSTSYEEVIFFFNPINTRAMTPGSKNYGGKKPIHTVLPTNHLKALKEANNPGEMYLKGGYGYGPIALSPGGRRPLNYSIETDMFTLVALSMPIEPLRNILSLVSNVKGVIRDVSKGVYAGKFTRVFVNTLERSWETKLGKVLGNAMGNVISKELGQHMSRVFGATLQGFTRTKSSTVVINGQKKHFTRTTFSFSNSFKPHTLIRKGLGQGALSFGLKRLPKQAIDKTTTTRSNIKYKRYGTTLRRVGTIWK